jgi:hypothetical protein
LREVTLAVYEGVVHGTTDLHLRRLVYGATGVQPAIGTELVEQVVSQGESQLVITDQNVYRYSAGTTVLVAVGDTVVAGQQLVSAVLFYDLSRGEVPTEIVGLVVDRAQLSRSYLDGLMFPNQEVSLQTETVDGRLKVSFELGGFSKDIVLFWNEVHQRGLEAGQTLAQLLDRREEPFGEPIAANLPAIINPTQFLIENIYRFSAFVIHIKISELTREKQLRHLQQLRRLVPPWYLCIVVLEVQVGEELIRMDGPGDTDSPGYQEELEATYGNTLTETISGPDFVTETLTACYTGFRCQ